jgi:hypothetical protein
MTMRCQNLAIHKLVEDIKQMIELAISSYDA